MGRRTRSELTEHATPIAKHAKLASSGGLVFPHAFSPPAARHAFTLSVPSPQQHLPDSLFEELRVRHYVHLSPSQMMAQPPKVAVIEALHALHLKYVSAFSGTAVHHDGDDGLEVACKSAFYVGDSPYAHFYVLLRWLVFAPKCGHRLYGMINFQGAEHLGLLVLGYFNASIAAEQMAATYRWNGYAWQNSNNDAILSNGQPIEFEVVEAEGTVDGLLTIRGSIDKMHSVTSDRVTKFSSRLPTEQYGDHIVLKRTLLDGSTARKRLKKVLPKLLH